MATVLLSLLSTLTILATVQSTGFYADNGLYQTVQVDKLPGNHRRAIKREILGLLGLEKRPRPPPKGIQGSIPGYMLDLWKTMEIDNGDIDEQEQVEIRRRLLRRHLTLPGMDQTAGEADVIMSFANHAGKSPLVEMGKSKDRLFWFDMSEVPVEQTAIGAELRLYKNATRGNMTYDIEIFRIIIEEGSDGNSSKKSFTPNSVLRTTVHDHFEGWLELDITSACRSWSHQRSKQIGLLIKITDQNGKRYNPRKMGIINRKGPESKKAFFVVFFRADHEVHVRRTRAARRRKDYVSYSHKSSYPTQPMPLRRQPPNIKLDRGCQRRTLYVSFQDLGWQDWVIAPAVYSAFYCHGECVFPLNVHMNATNHAIVQTLVNLYNPIQVPKPSCASTELTDLSVLHFDDNSNVILRKCEAMVVRACGCR